MRVQKSRADDPPGDVQFFFAVVFPDARDFAAGDRDVARAELMCEHIDIARVFEHQLGASAPGRRFDQTALLVGFLPECSVVQFPLSSHGFRPLSVFLWIMFSIP